MNPSLASLALVVIAGTCLVFYLLGFNAGKDEGRGEGHEKGKAEGKKEGAVRAFAVGYDRGKREASGDDEDDDGEKADSAPNLVVIFVLILGTVVILTLISF